MSINSHSNFLRKHYKEDDVDQKILSFTVNILNQIYDRPYVDENILNQYKIDKKIKGSSN